MNLFSRGNHPRAFHSARFSFTLPARCLGTARPDRHAKQGPGPPTRQRASPSAPCSNALGSEDTEGPGASQQRHGPDQRWGAENGPTAPSEGTAPHD